MKSMSSLARAAAAALGAVLLVAVLAQAQTGGGLYNPPSGTAAGYFPTDLRTAVLYNDYQSPADNAKWTFRTDSPGLVGELVIRHTPGTTSSASRNLWLEPSAAVIVRSGLLFFGDGERDIGAPGVRPRDILLAGSVTTGQVNSQSPAWKLGAVTTEACTVDTTKTIRVNIGGVDVKLAPCL